MFDHMKKNGDRSDQWQIACEKNVGITWTCFFIKLAGRGDLWA
jgi:hypothetical protein